MSRVLLQRGLLVVGAVALGAVLAWWSSQSGDDGIARLASWTAPAPAGVPSPDALPASGGGQPSGSAGSAQLVPSTSGQPISADLAAVAVTVASPQKLQVGEQTELRVGVGGNAAVGEVSFTIHFDPNVLQARTGTQGDWAGGGADMRFAAEVTDAGDRVQIRSAAAGRRVHATGGTVAVVQFQAVAPGASSVMITDVTVKDSSGNAMPFSLSSSNLQVLAESVVPPAHDARHTPAVATTEPPAPDTAEAGD